MAESAAPSDEELTAVFADGPLGVLVTRSASGPLLTGLLAEAARLGIPTRVFFTDEAVTLLGDEAWVGALPEGSYAACELSASRLGVQAAGRVSMAGQYQNALLVRDAVRVISL